MPTKRIWTFEHCAWLAHRHQIALRMPREHPFNPIKLLRLALACAEAGVVPTAAISRIFQYVWVDNHLPQDVEPFAALLAELGRTPEDIEAPAVKTALRDNGQRAIAAGVFGVPTSVVNGWNFWGFEATEMLEAFLNDDPFFSSELFAAARTTPAGVQRIRPPR